MVCILWVGGSYAQDYPKGPVQIVIPFSPGGGTDLFWRSISEDIAKSINGTVVFVNKTGGGGVVGTSFVANATADGYTLVSANSDPLNLSPVFGQVPYNPEKDFTYLAKLVAFCPTLSARIDAPYKTLEELVAFAKANPRKVKAGVAGVGTIPHIAVEMLNREAKVEIVPVPFGSGGEVTTSLLGGHVDIALPSAAAIKSHALAGKARILAVFSPTRLAEFSQIPTLGEKGYKASNVSTGVGLAGPKGLPPAIAKKWEDAVEKMLKDQKVIEAIGKMEGYVIDFKKGEGYKREILADLEVFREVVPKLTGKK
jgi:tripartite-type tricarboxylate transporter receptor subunit TctC